MDINKFFTQLAKNPKLLLIWVVVLIVIIILGRYFYKWLKNNFGNNSGNTGTINKNNLTYTESEYLSMAEILFRAMDGAGTDEQKIFDVIARIRTKDDWTKLKSVFGVKKSSTWTSTFEGTLIEWLTDECSTSDISKINQLLSSINERI